MAYIAYAQAIIAAVGTYAAIKQGEAQKNAQKASLRLQEQTQREALSAALRQDALNAQALAKENAKKPNLDGLVAYESSRMSGGAGGSLMVGPGVSGPARLGKAGLLGDVGS